MILTWRLRGDNVVPHWWWGLCWYEDFNQVRVFSVIGLNVVLVGARWVWKKLAYELSLRVFNDRGIRTDDQDQAVATVLAAMAGKCLTPDRSESGVLPDGTPYLNFYSSQTVEYDALEYAIAVLRRQVK